MKENKFPKLEAEMKKHKESQYALARLLKVSQPTVCRKLSGETEWNIGEIDILCEHYKKDYYQLFK